MQTVVSRLEVALPLLSIGVSLHFGKKKRLLVAKFEMSRHLKIVEMTLNSQCLPTSEVGRKKISL